MRVPLDWVSINANVAVAAVNVIVIFGFDVELEANMSMKKPTVPIFLAPFLARHLIVNESPTLKLSDVFEFI